jgi:SpoVK/Ycf46/Vps4 family AAA+-type ATPase
MSKRNRKHLIIEETFDDPNNDPNNEYEETIEEFEESLDGTLTKIEPPPSPAPRELINLNEKVDTLDDLINLAKQYDPSKDYNINLKKLNKILPVLEKLKGVIGMKSVKDSIVGQIIFFLNEFNNQDMLHTIIQGPPGVGKTTLGKIIGELYYKMDILKPVEKKPPSKKRRGLSLQELLNLELDDYQKGEGGEKEVENENDFNFKIIKRSQLVGKYLGHTSKLTQEVIDSCEGGVMFIDEAYSLGNEEGRDSFAKECIDTINQNLSEQKCNFLCIIAGYKDALDKCFFSYNEGLRRRFPFVYTIEKYTSEELCLIFKKMVTDIGWSINDISNKFFKENYECFNNMGGDMESLLFICKIESAKRTLFFPDQRKKINNEDLEKGLKMFKVNKDIKKPDESWRSLYV